MKLPVVALENPGRVPEGKWEKGKMGGNGGNWGEMGANGGEWGEMGGNGSKWGEMGGNGGKWGGMGGNRQKRGDLGEIGETGGATELKSAPSAVCSYSEYSDVRMWVASCTLG